MNKCMDGIKKVILFVCLLSVIWIMHGTLLNISGFSLGTSDNTSFIAFLGIFIAAQLILLLIAAFRVIDRIREEKQRWITMALFGGMVLIFILLLSQLHPRPTEDSFDDLDTAMYILDNGAVTKDPIHNCIKYFKNNHTLVLLFTIIFRLFEFLGLEKDVLFPLYVLNVAAVLMAAWLAWRIVKITCGISAANKALLLCVLNPIYYGIIFWIYSLLYSIPIMLGIIYIGILLYRSRKIGKAILYGGLLGLLTVLGYAIRPTSFFPMIAGLILMPYMLKTLSRFKKVLLMGGVGFILAAGISGIVIHTAENTYFSEVKESNYPIWYWLSMGSHGNGDLSTNDEDWELAKYTEGYAERSAVLKQRTIDNYKKLGITGVIKLWLAKTQTTWSDGYSSQNSRMNYGEIDSILYELIAGEKNLPYQLYSQAYRLVLELGFVLFCISHLSGRRMKNIHFILLITFLGGLFFHMLWEAKDIYSAQFLHIMIILASEGIEEKLEPGSRRTEDRKNGRHFLIPVYISVTLFAAVIWVMLFQTELTFEYSRIHTMTNNRVNTALYLAESISQDFYVSAPFNKLVFMAKADPDAEVYSEYSVKLYDSGGTLLLDEVVKEDQIKSKRISIEVKKIHTDSHYRLYIDKLDPDKGDILFYTKSPYYFDSYNGSLSVNGSENYTSDLNMDVLYKVTRRYFSESTTAAWVIVYLGLSGFIILGYVLGVPLGVPGKRVNGTWHHGLAPWHQWAQKKMGKKDKRGTESE